MVLLAAFGLAIGAFPFRATWWGGWILAIAEAGIVGGLADWFAVTALFRHPLGLPIPHTALVPANWQLMAARLGSMVGGRVLTPEYVTREIARIDVAGLLANAASRVKPADLEAAVAMATRWVADQVSPRSATELVAWLRRLLIRRPVAPLLAEVMDVAHAQGWDQRMIETLARMLADALNRPDVRRVVGEVTRAVVTGYRRRMGLYPGVLIGLASLVGLIDANRLVSSLQAALEKIAADPHDPLRRRFSEALAGLPKRLRSEPELIARVEAAKQDLLGSAAVTELIEDAAAGFQRMLVADLAGGRSELVAWITEQLEGVRQTLTSAARDKLDRWLKERAAHLVETYQDRVASFIERGVHALGSEGVVRLLEEHAGDDLQYIRVNGTVVGSLAGGAIYAVHLLLRWL